jgi:hypothetical protein
MTTSRLALILAVTSAAAWTAKAVAIALAGGLGKSPAEGPLFFLGLVAFVAGAITVALALTARRTRGQRLVLVLAVLACVAAPMAVVGVAATALQPPRPGWVWGEVNLWAGAVTLLVVAVVTWRTRQQPVPMSDSRESVSVT